MFIAEITYYMNGQIDSGIARGSMTEIRKIVRSLGQNFVSCVYL